MKIGLFDIGQEYKGLYELANEVVEDENGQIVDTNNEIGLLFDELQGKLIDKLDATNYIIKELNINIGGLSDEIKRLQNKKKVLDNKVNTLKKLMKDTIISSGELNYKGKFSFNVGNRKTFNYDSIDVNSLEERFVKIKKELKKDELKKFVKNGGKIDGLKIEDSTILTIR